MLVATGAVCSAFLGVSGLAAGVAVHATAFVSPAGVSVGADASCGSAAYTGIQAAVDAVGTGGTVHVCPGTYRTTVQVASSDLTIVGTGSTSVVAPSAVTCGTVETSLTGAHVWAPIVDVERGVSGVTVSGVQVVGSAVGSYAGTTPTRCGLVGVLFDGASGSLVDASVDDIAGPQRAGKDVGIAVVGGAVTVTGTQVSGYESNGVICDTEADCTITQDAVTGAGAESAVPQTGVQVSGGATGSVSDDTVDDNAFAGATTEGIGILVLESSDVAVLGNSLHDNQATIVVGSFGHGGDASMTTDRISGNSISYDRAFDAFGTTIAGVYVFADAPASVATAVQHNTIEGPGIEHAGIAGLELGTQYSYGAYYTRFRYGQVIVSATGNRITDWRTDVLAAGVGVTAQLRDNDLLGGSSVVGVANRSHTVGAGTTAISVVHAAANWWGCTQGPNAAGCTTTLGSVADSSWLTSAATTSAPPGPRGYRTAGSNGGIFSFGSASFRGSLEGVRLGAPIVGMAATATDGGYWLVAANGGIFSFGSAPFEGSMGGRHLNAPIVGMAATATGEGYWMVASDGGIFSFGAARFHGSMGSTHLNAPIVGLAADPVTGGYWMVASDGGIFSFTAPFEGSMGGRHLNAPVVGMAATATGEGYWIVTSDGGVFNFGTAAFHGSPVGTPLGAPVVGVAGDPATGGYWIVTSDGAIFGFTAPFEGDELVNVPVVAMAS